MPSHTNGLEPIEFREETVLIIPYMTQRQRCKGIVFRNKSTKLCVADYAKKKVQRVSMEVQMNWTAKYVGFFVSAPSLPQTIQLPRLRLIRRQGSSQKYSEFLRSTSFFISVYRLNK
jgi:hypothetical protein